MRLLLSAALLALTATPILAENFRCVRTSLSSNGFVNAQAAESWFPKVIEFRVNGDDVVSNYYGSGSVQRKGGRLYFKFDLEADGSHDRSVTYTFIPKSGRFSAKLGAYGRYATTNGSRGKCQTG
ncbi:hypothetical protein AIOL_002448 [Candidatus Rhodobacter oscarellae]|uniref:Uncharacterized protein n=1 Tax=Candidatus Rhodobacter oscarellae TaxID=1675527 RepID=A0A0J9GV83_9RHOB|nr:hypothetical protein [Candidatus Rhodobacter lobularis]KMW57483.1 hypothetical protein AIOL_002448 [Candidatus Rhodobacter lobularis]